MADIYNVVRGDGVFFEGMTKEQIYELIAEMTGETVQDIDQAFITKLKEINKGNSIRLWVGTSAEYNALTVREDDVLYICTDDSFVADTNMSIVALWEKIESNYDSVEQRLDEQDTSFEEFKEEVNDTLEAFGSAMVFRTSSHAFPDGNETRYTVPSIGIGEMMILSWSTPNDSSFAPFALPSSGRYLVCTYASNYWQPYYNDSDSNGWTRQTNFRSNMTIVDGGTEIGGTNNDDYPQYAKSAYYGNGILVYMRIA